MITLSSNTFQVICLTKQLWGFILNKKIKIIYKYFQNYQNLILIMLINRKKNISKSASEIDYSILINI